MLAVLGLRDLTQLTDVVLPKEVRLTEVQELTTPEGTRPFSAVMRACAVLTLLALAPATY